MIPASTRSAQLYQSMWVLCILSAAFNIYERWDNQASQFFTAGMVALLALSGLLASRSRHVALTVFALGMVPLSAWWCSQVSAQPWVMLPAFATLAMLLGRGGVALAGVAAIVSLVGFPVAELQTFSFLALGIMAVVLGNAIASLKADYQHASSVLDQSPLLDRLTGLGNRRALEGDYERLQSLAGRRGIAFGVVVWDVNGLRGINETFGALAGDAYLQEFVNKLREVARREDGLYRLEGDAFVTLGVGLEDAQPLLLRVRERFPYVNAGWVRGDAITLEESLRQADHKLELERAATIGVVFEARPAGAD